MRIHWSIRSVPELAELPEENRNEILGRCGLTNFENGFIGYPLKLLMLPFMLGGGALGGICAGKIGGGVGFVIGSAIGAFVVLQRPVWIVRFRIHKYLSTHGKFD